MVDAMQIAVGDEKKHMRENRLMKSVDFLRDPAKFNMRHPHVMRW